MHADEHADAHDHALSRTRRRTRTRTRTRGSRARLVAHEQENVRAPLRGVLIGSRFSVNFELLNEFPTAAELLALLRVARDVPKILPFVGRYGPARIVEENAARTPERVALLFGGERFTWEDVDWRASRYARFFERRGIGRGDVVALLMDNRPDFLFVELGLQKIGAVAALLNTTARGAPLAHAIAVAAPKIVVVGSEHEAAIAEIANGVGRAKVVVQKDPEARDMPEGVECIDAAVARENGESVVSRRGFIAGEAASYIFTSGTTGLPKAAIISNQRVVGAAAMYARGLYEFVDGDVLYCTLPLYHASAQWMGFAACALGGVTLALRRKFSVTAFFSDVRAFGATHFLYIGEICRYLLGAPEQEGERDHRLKMGVGNGLRADVWTKFEARFGVPLMREFYGATEGNTILVNLEGRPGMIGKKHGGQKVLRCDAETGAPTRNGKGLCEEVGVGETGLFVARINPLVRFDGYVDAKATAKKLLADVLKKGDAYFNSGDLLTLHEGGWLSFADRVGDTFRWKGENVSTNEVALVLDAAPGVLESNVYGVEVPGREGRCGMASVRAGEGFDLVAFAAYVREKLAAHQRPYFLRVQTEMELTATFKQKKGEYRSAGFDPSKSSDPLFYLDGPAYVPIDAGLYEKLARGEIGPR